MADKEKIPDYHFAAFVTNLGKYNEGDLIGEWVKFPVTPDEMQNVFKCIGIGQKDIFGIPYEEWFISDYDCYIDGIYDIFGEYESLDELNYLAGKLNELSDEEMKCFKAVVQMGEHTNSVKDLINLTENLDCYNIYPDINNDYDLGYYYVEESGCYNNDDLGVLKHYIDYEAFGHDIARDEDGDFTKFGYVVCNQSNFYEVYDGNRDDIPAKYRISAIPDIETEHKDVDAEKKPSIRQQLAENKAKLEKTKAAPTKKKEELSL